MSSRAWAAFRFARKVVFALAAILSIAWTIIFMVLLLHEWKAYRVVQRVVVVMSLAINAVSAVFSYLMIVVMFRLRQDAVRVAFFLMLQLGSTVTFTLFSPNLPCKNLGSELECRRITSVVIYGSWILTGLLLSYGFYLAAMSYITPPPSDPEAALLDTKEAYPPDPPAYSMPLNRSSVEKRRSVGSIRSHGSLIQPLSANPSVYRSPLILSVGSISASSHGKEVHSRPCSRTSMYSSAFSLTSTIRGPKNNQAYIPQTHAQGMDISESLPNPFADPVSRLPSPSSVVAVEIHLPLQPPPPVLYSPYEINGGQARPLPPIDADLIHPNASTVPLNATKDSLLSGPWDNVGTPISPRPSLQPPSSPRKYTASPGIESVHSMVASLYSERSSGPRKGGQLASPAFSTRSLGLPTTPRLPGRQLPLPETRYAWISNNSTEIS